MLGERSMCLGHGIETMIRQNGPMFPFLKVADKLNGADIVFGDLISVLSAKGRNKTAFISECIRGLPHYAKGLSSSGFNVISLANNHSMQHGKDSLLECIQALRTQGIKTIGTIDQHGKSLPERFHLKEVQIGFLGYLCMSQDFNLDSPMNAQGEISIISEDIKHLKTNGVDLVAISLHWGHEFIQYPSLDQIRFGRSIIDAGADIILGHHSHVIQGIERYNGGLIAYGLGNFIMDFWQDKMRQGLVLEIDLTKDGIKTWNAMPIWINDCFQPEFMQRRNADEVLREVGYLSSELEREDLSDPITKDQKFKQDLAKVHRRYRKDVLKYYMKHLIDYDPMILLRNAAVIAKRRLLHKKM
jgi:poly-gamma-glutamate synthesis protein (capsule biosynthesis protein)